MTTNYYRIFTNLFAVITLLRKLKEKFGIKGKPPGSFGKIVQKLLILSFQ